MVFFQKVFAYIGSKTSKDVTIVQLSASFFALTPILERLKEVSKISLEPEILQGSITPVQPEYWNNTVENVLQRITQSNLHTDLGPHLNLKAKLNLDESQKMAIVNTMRNRVGLIQGPPGTGKSYCGAILAKIIHDFTNETIMCVCYTNHALDQFLEDLIHFGIPTKSVVRVGGSPRVSDPIKPFILKTLLTKEGKKESSRTFFTLRRRLDVISKGIALKAKEISDLSNSLKFVDFEPFLSEELLAEFEIPRLNDGFRMVDEKNRPIGKHYLWQRWLENKDRGVYQKNWPGKISSVWKLNPSERQIVVTKCRESIMEQKMEEFENEKKRYNSTVQELRDLNQLAEIELLKSKRIIGCTTTGAAKYAAKLDAINAGVLIMEEAGEILEPHVITSKTCQFHQYFILLRLFPYRHVTKLQTFDCNRRSQTIKA